MSYWFVAPSHIVVNDADSGTFDLNFGTTADAPSAYPAKHRGIYFTDANNGYIRIDGVVLNHTMAVHVWVLTHTSGTYTVLSKDRDSFTGNCS